jgi:hypothetical protein
VNTLNPLQQLIRLDLTDEVLDMLQRVVVEDVF